MRYTTSLTTRTEIRILHKALRSASSAITMYQVRRSEAKGVPRQCPGADMPRISLTRTDSDAGEKESASSLTYLPMHEAMRLVEL